MPTMAICKAKKKSKLRYAEYYDFQCIQDKLYTDSMKGTEFKNLVELITLPQNIKLSLCDKQLQKLNKLRNLANIEEIV